MIRVDHLREHVIRPALRAISVDRPMDTPAAIELLVGTYLAESRVGGNTALVQLKGPALGVFQMEPPTYWWLRRHDSILQHLPERYATRSELQALGESIDSNMRELRHDVRTQTELLQRILVEDRSAHRGIRGSDD